MIKPVVPSVPKKVVPLPKLKTSQQNKEEMEQDLFEDDFQSTSSEKKQTKIASPTLERLKKETQMEIKNEKKEEKVKEVKKEKKKVAETEEEILEESKTTKVIKEIDDKPIVKKERKDRIDDLLMQAFLKEFNIELSKKNASKILNILGDIIYKILEEYNSIRIGNFYIKISKESARAYPYLKKENTYVLIGSRTIIKMKQIQFNDSIKSICKFDKKTNSYVPLNEKELKELKLGINEKENKENFSLISEQMNL
jgi:hypothetical protein